MGYPPGQRGYRVRSIATHHFFTSGNVIFDENIPYQSLHSVPAASHDYSTLPFTVPRLDPPPDLPSTPPPPNLPNLSDFDQPRLPPTPSQQHHSIPPPAPNPIRTRSRDDPHGRKLTEKGRTFEAQIEASKDH